MAKLYFYYASMNAGKSTNLLQADFNYRERGMETMLYTAAVHDRAGFGIIHSRIGAQASANTFEAASDLRAEIEAEIKQRRLSCILIDEAQFLTRGQVLRSPPSATSSTSPSSLMACAPTSKACCSKAAARCWRSPTAWSS